MVIFGLVMAIVNTSATLLPGERVMSGFRELVG